MTNTEKNLKFLIYTGLAVILYVPFIVSNSLFFPYVTGKAFAFRIVVEILVAIWLILAILYPKYRPKKNWILVSFVLFTLSLFISNLFGVNQTASFWSKLERMEGWVTIVHLLGLFIVMGSVLNTKKEWYAFFKVSVFASFIMSMVAANELQKLGDDAALVSRRILTTIGNSSYVGVYALFNAFLSLLLVLKDTDRLSDLIKRTNDTLSKNWPILFYIITFFLNAWMIFQSGTRGAMLGFMGGLLLIGLLMAFLEKKKTIYKKISFGFIAAAIIFTGAIVSMKETDFVQGNQALNRFASIFAIERTETGIKLEGTSQARVNNWIHATRGFQERPILGWGQSNFNYVYDKYYLPRHHGNELWFDRAHNIIFDWLIAGGIFGLLFYLSIWVSTVLSVFKTSKFQNSEKAILISTLGAYFVHLLFVFDALVSYLYFIFIIAFVYSVVTEDKESCDYQINDLTKKIVIWIIILITPFIVYLVNYQPYKAAGELVKASTVAYVDSNGQTGFYHENPIIDNIKYFQSVIDRDTFATAEARSRIMVAGNSVFNLNVSGEGEQAQQFNAVKSQYATYLYEQVNKQIEEEPNNSKYPYLFSGSLAQIGQFEEAEKFALMAIELSPTKQLIRTPLINIYTRTDQPEKALALAKETYELDESKGDMWIMYAKVAARFDAELFNQLIDKAIEEGNESWVESLLKENITNNPDSLQNIISLSAFYVRVGNTTSSLEVLNDAIELFPENESQIGSLKKQIESGIDPTGTKY